MNHHHRNVLHAIFAHPARANIAPSRCIRCWPSWAAKRAMVAVAR